MFSLWDFGLGFWAGAVALFIHWRVAAERRGESGARFGRRRRCHFLWRWLAGGAGRARGSASPRPACNGVVMVSPACSRSGISGWDFGLARWCSLSIGGWQPSGAAAPTISFFMIAGGAAAASELGGRLRQHQIRDSTPCATLRRALSPDFSAGALVVFIPWRVGAEESGAANYGFGGALLRDLLGPPGRGAAAADRTMVRSPAAPIHFSDIPVRGDAGARAIGANDDAAAVELPGRRRRHP